MTDRGLISLTFDDALDVHLDNAVVILDQAGLSGSFYAHLSAPSLSKRTNDWRAAAAAGHEIGNHTAFHPALLKKDWVTVGNAIDFYTLDRMRIELQLDAYPRAALHSLAKHVATRWLGLRFDGSKLHFSTSGLLCCSPWRGTDIR